MARCEGRFPPPAAGSESDKSIEARIQRAIENMQVPLAARRGKWYGNSFALGAAFFGLDAHSHSLDGRLYLHDIPGGDRSTALPKSAALDFIQPPAMPVGLWEFYPLAMLPQEWFPDWVDNRLSRNLSMTALVGVPVVEVQVMGVDFPLSLTGELATIRFMPIAVPFTYHIMPQHLIDPFLMVIPIWSFTYHERVEGRGYLGDNTKPDKVRIHFNNPWTVALGFGADLNLSDRFFFKFMYSWMPRIRIHANIQGINLLGTGIDARVRAQHLKIDGGFYGIATGMRF
jgi:outer membrane protein W